MLIHAVQTRVWSGAWERGWASVIVYLPNTISSKYIWFENLLPNTLSLVTAWHNLSSTWEGTMVSTMCELWDGIKDKGVESVILSGDLHTWYKWRWFSSLLFSLFLVWRICSKVTISAFYAKLILVLSCWLGPPCVVLSLCNLCCTVNVPVSLSVCAIYCKVYMHCSSEFRQLVPKDVARRTRPFGGRGRLGHRDLGESRSYYSHTNQGTIITVQHACLCTRYYIVLIWSSVVQSLHTAKTKLLF